MATKKKNWQISVKESSRKFLAFLLVIVVIAFLLRTKVVSGFIGGLLGVDPGMIQEYAGYIFGFAIGASLVYAGAVAFAALPAVGVLLLVVGAVFLIMEGVRLWNNRGKGNDLTLL